MTTTKVLNPPSRAEITEKLLFLVEDGLGIKKSDILVTESFTSYGLDSMDALMIVGDLEDWLGIQLPSTLLWDCETVNEVSEFIFKQIKDS